MDANKIKSLVHMFVNSREIGNHFTLKDLREKMGIPGHLHSQVKTVLNELSQENVIHCCNSYYYQDGKYTWQYEVDRKIAKPYIYNPAEGFATGGLKSKLASVLGTKTLADYTDDELVAELKRRIAA